MALSRRPHFRCSRWLSMLPVLVLALSLRAPTARADNAVRLPDAGLLEKYPDFARLYNKVSATDAGKSQALQAFYSHKATFAAYDPAVPETVKPAREAMAELFAFVSEGGEEVESNLKSIHWLLKQGAIEEDLSRRMADIRNDMVREICEDMARKYGEIHRIDFSPATSLLSDIDQTFRAIARLKEMGISGETLKAEFADMWKLKFGVDPTFLDVVSHPHEARIPDWRIARPDVHVFAAELRKGSALLAGNDEAYFLEGAFRMQIDRRSYASEQELYSMFAANPHDPDAPVARIAVVEMKTGTAKRYGYKIAPEARRSYAWGSSVGNWFFFAKHAQHDPEMAVRYAAKYGLRSFSEGPGWLILSQDPDPENLPSTYEELVSRPIERGDVLKKVYDAYYANQKPPLSFDELKWTMETALAVRAQKENYRGEQRAAVLREKAIELAGSAAAYQKAPDAWHTHVEELFKANMTKAFTHHIMVSLPERLHDWLDPQVDPRALGLTDEQIKNKDPRIEAARKQLRTTALFETLHGLRTLDPVDRVKAIERAKNYFQKNPVSREGKQFGFQKTLDAVLKLALQDADPNLLMTDDAKRVRRTLTEGASRVPIHDDRTPDLLERKMRGVQLRFAALEKEFDSAFAAELTAVADGDPADTLRGMAGDAMKWTIEDFKNRWDVARDGIGQSMGDGFLAALDSGERSRLVSEYRRSVFDSLGFEFRKDWTAVEGIEPTRDMTWSPKKALNSVATLGNADSLLNIVKAYRSSNGNSEVVGNTILTEVFTNLPVVGTVLNFNAFLQGDLKAGVVMGVSYLYPGIGQVYLAFNVVTGAYALAADVATDSQVNMFYQGTLRNKDMRLGPVNPNWIPEDKPMFKGILEARVGRAFSAHRGKLQIEYQFSQDPKQRESIRLEIAERFPENIEGMKNYMFLHYDRRLNRALEGRFPKDEWDGRKLSDHMPPIRSNDPRDMRDPANLPPMLRAFFRSVAMDYMRGRGKFARLPRHKKAHEDPFLRQNFFHDDGQNTMALDAKAEQLATTLAASFRDALLAERSGGDTTAKFDYRFGYEEDAAYVQPLVIGLTGEQVREEYPWLEKGTVADLPSILDVVPGATFAEKQKNFFLSFDRELNRRFEANARANGQPLPDDPRAWDHEKLGLKHADLRPIASEERAVQHPLLLSFFMKEVRAYFNDKSINSTDTGQANLSSILTKQKDIETKLAQQLLTDYKIGLLKDIARRERERQQKLLDMRLPVVHAKAELDRAIWGPVGGNPNPNRSAALDVLALHSGDPMINVEGPDQESAVEDPFAEWMRVFDEDAPGSKIEIVGDIKQLKPRGMLQLKCLVRASRHFQRPFDVKWSIVGPDGKADAEPVAGIKSSNLWDVKVKLGNAPDVRDFKILAEVFDSSTPRRKVGDATRDLSAGAEPKGVVFTAASNTMDFRSGMARLQVHMRVDFPTWDKHFRNAEYPEKSRDRPDEVFWLMRLEYDGMVALSANTIREFPHIRNKFVEGDWDYHLVQAKALAPTRRTGRFPAKVSFYTGPSGFPVFTHEFELVIPTAQERKDQRRQKPKPGNVTQKRMKYYEGKIPEIRKDLRGARNEAQRLKRYEKLMYSERDYVQAKWTLETGPWLQEQGRSDMERLEGYLTGFNGNFFDFGNITQVVEFVELVVQMRVQLGEIEEADSILQLMERHAKLASGERATKKVQAHMGGSNMGSAYRRVAHAYALVRCDGEKAMAMLKRSPYWTKRMNDASKLGDKNKELLVEIQRAGMAQKFFPREAFGK